MIPNSLPSLRSLGIRVLTSARVSVARFMEAVERAADVHSLSPLPLLWPIMSIAAACSSFLAENNAARPSTKRHCCS